MKLLKMMYEFCVGFETRTDTLKKFCDQVLWINDSKFVKLGDTEEVLDEYDRFMKL